MVENTNTFQFVGKADGEYKLITEEIPKPAENQVLIRIEYSTCNPVDRYTYAGGAVPRLGSDGSGVIVEAGSGVDQALVGKKVAFLSEAWGQYKLSSPHSLIILDDSQDLTKAANSGVNPLTAVGQLHYAKKIGAKTVISMAASS